MDRVWLHEKATLWNVSTEHAEEYATYAAAGGGGSFFTQAVWFPLVVQGVMTKTTVLAVSTPASNRMDQHHYRVDQDEGVTDWGISSVSVFVFWRLSLWLWWRIWGASRACRKRLRKLWPKMVSKVLGVKLGRVLMRVGKCRQSIENRSGLYSFRVR